MVVRAFIYFLLTFCLFADVKFRFIRYTGNGSSFANFKTGLDTISMVIISPLASNYSYIRTASVDSISGTEPLTGGDNTNISYAFPGPSTNITTTGILQWQSDTIYVGSSCNNNSVDYVCWAFSDPTEEVLITDYYKGNGSSPRVISTGYADTLEAWFGICPTTSAAAAGPSIWANINYPADPTYFGERGNNDLSAFVSNQFTIDAGAINDWNENGYWYIWYGFKEVDRYVRLAFQVGDGAGTEDTLVYNVTSPDSFKAFYAVGSGWFGASVGAGSTYGWDIGADTSFQYLWSTGGALVVGANTIYKNITYDTVFVRGNSWLDASGFDIRVYAIGDTAIFLADTTVIPTGGGGRPPPPCAGSIDNIKKGEIEWVDRY